ncbi:MAG TPA: hypothetical protein PKJ99_07145 [Thermoanaerobaculales bacterium]|nr:hypothetical protein [Thermoanaerobaculales bacterium]HPA80295.1 hypothetical protein [Thermoanaerobaculales bacterium]HQL29085.1 hypothetical protein [Thermoanaerobaculales bacterium]
MSRRLIAVCAGLLLPMSSGLAAQDCPELVGRWPATVVQAVAIAGDHAYIAGRRELLIADVSDPSAPRPVGNVRLPHRVWAHDVAVSGSYAYVADNDSVLRVIDVSTPSAPVEVGSKHFTGDARSVAVSGSYAYVAAFRGGLWVIDVSTPSAPRLVGWVDIPGTAESVAVSGSYAYVTDRNSLRIIEVSTPTAPVEVGFLDMPGSDASSVVVSGGYAYVTDRYTLRVIDVSTPSAPVEVGFLYMGRRALSIAASGSHAYVADYDGVLVINISVPSLPLVVGYVDVPQAADVAAEAGYAYVVNDDTGLRVIDASTPSAPRQVGSLDMPFAFAVAASGNYAYVVGGPPYPEGGDLLVIDVSTGTALVEVGVFRFGSEYTYPIEVAASGGSAYVIYEISDDETIRGSGLRVIDVSTPWAPAETGSIVWEGLYAQGVAVSCDYAYVAAAGSGLHVIDVSTPSAPVEVGHVDFPGSARSVAVSGSYAYVAAGWAGLRVIDISTPSWPVEVGSLQVWGEVRGVAAEGSYAFLADRDWGLRVIDISTPWAPVEVGFVDTPTLPSDVAVWGGYAYVNNYSPFGLSVIDVRTPSAPVEVASYDTPYWGIGDERTGIAVSEGYVYFAAWDAGLYVFRECPAPALDSRESFIPAAAVAAGAQGAFFSTDLEINNTGAEEAEVHFQWLPRGEDNSAPTQSEAMALAPGQSLRYENVLTEVFGLEPDSLGALKMTATTESVIGMSRTYNIPAGETAGTFGQGLPAIRATEMIQGAEPQRIIFLSENDDSRANVGCVNGTDQPLRINIGVFDAEGSPLETKTMDLAPYSNNQINRIFEDYAPVNGYVDVRADSDDALYSCYGSMLDNLTSDPTTILPQVPSADTSFVPAAALAAGLEGAFFSTDVDLNNVGSTDITYRLAWLPRGEDNSEAVHSEPFSLAPGASVRYANVLDEVFGLEPDQVGALAVEASGIDLLAMSRTYNLPSAKVAGTFGQELPGIPADKMIVSGVKKRIIFMNENDDVRANVGCQNGVEQTVRVFIELFNSAGESLETKTMDLAPWSNNQITRVFRNYSPVEAGYVDVWTTTEGASIYCYGSVLDNLTSDPTTVLPQ